MHALIHIQTDPFTHVRHLQRQFSGRHRHRRERLHSLTFTHSYIDQFFFLFLSLSLSRPALALLSFVCLSVCLSVSCLFYSGVFFSPPIFLLVNDLLHSHTVHIITCSARKSESRANNNQKCPNERECVCVRV